jgi:putative restriction endonuclease
MYQGTDPNRADNVSMKLAEELELPLAWLVGTGEGVYSATYPVYIVSHNDEDLEFTVAVDEEQRALFDEPRLDSITKRRYAVSLTERRLHQRIFRTIVMRAYRDQCSICRLAHTPLLDAAHILGDANGGEPVVTNGVSMCKIHHAAYDANIMSITPDYKVAINAYVLIEKDGPMLRHGLQEMHGERIQLPRSRRERPDRDALALRHEAFLNV